MTTKVLQPEIDHGSGYFDVAGLCYGHVGERICVGRGFRSHLAEAGGDPGPGGEACVRRRRAFRFACAMVNPAWVSLAHSVMAGSGVPVGVVVGFPLGANLATSKREEALALIKLGAHELDMVMNLGLLKSGMNALVEQDIRGVVQVAHDAGALVKVILETSLLSVEEKLRALRAGPGRGYRLPQDQHRVFYGWSYARRRCDPARGCRQSLRCKGFGRHSHAGGCARHAGGRRDPHRRQRQRRYLAGVSGRILRSELAENPRVGFSQPLERTGVHQYSLHLSYADHSSTKSRRGAKPHKR